jgi:hypothetical protein
VDAGPGSARLNVFAGEGDKVAAVADAHRVVAQDLEQLAARSGARNLTDWVGMPVFPDSGEPGARDGPGHNRYPGAGYQRHFRRYQR